MGNRSVVIRLQLSEISKLDDQRHYSLETVSADRFSGLHVFIFIFLFIQTLLCSFCESVSVHNDLLTHSTVQSPSWAAIWFAASQEIPRISRNPKVHYRTHKRPPPVSILVQPNPVHIPTSHLLEIHPNIIHPSTPRSPQWSLAFWLTHSLQGAESLLRS